MVLIAAIAKTEQEGFEDITQQYRSRSNSRIRPAFYPPNA